MSGLRPNFFIVGAPKCGTTALVEYLRGHPEIFLCEPKEPNFFNRDFDYYHSGDPDSIDGYLSLFDDANESHSAIGEASVWYLHSQVAAERIAEFDPNARIIAMVRNPIELASALHRQLLYVLDEEVQDFERAWDLQEERRSGRSIPARCRQPAFLQYQAVASLSWQIERFQSRFPAEQIRLIPFDDFAKDTQATYRSTLDFLGLEDDGRSDFEPVNESKVHLSQTLSRFTQRPPGALMRVANSMKRVLGISQLGILERIRSVNKETRKREPIPPAFLAKLRNAFRPEVERLGGMLGRDLSHWLEDSAR